MTRHQVESLELRMHDRFEGLEGQIRRLDARVSRQLFAHISVSVATILATAGAVLAAVGAG